MHDLLSCHCSLASSYVVYLYMPMYILIHAYVDTYTCIFNGWEEKASKIAWIFKDLVQIEPRVPGGWFWT